MRQEMVHCGDALVSQDKLTDDGDIVLGSLELPERDIDSDTALTLSLQLVEHPRILEGTLAEFSGFLFFVVSILFIFFLHANRVGNALEFRFCYSECNS